MNKFILFLMVIISTNCYADSKITDMTADSSPVRANLTVEVITPSGTPANRKVTLGAVADLASNLTSASINWQDINRIATINSGGINWPSVNGVIPGAGVNWTDVVGLINPTNSLKSGIVPIANLATGTPDGTKFIRDDGTLVTPSGGGSTNWVTQNTTDVSIAGGNVGIGTTLTTNAALIVMNGNIGIGTWKPTSDFQIRQSGSTSLNGVKSVNAGNTQGIIMWEDSGQIGHISGGTTDTGVLVLNGGGAGNIGIGTATVTSTFLLKQNVNTNSGGMTILNSASTGSYRVWEDASNVSRIDGGSTGSGNISLNGAGGTGNIGIGTNVVASKINVFGASGLGWSVKAGANTACSTTCPATSSCVFGEDTSVLGSFVDCTDATADRCLCAGP